MKMHRKLQSRRKATGGYLEGQLLIAMPGMPDKRFARSVIYLCAHSPEGAMGLIINQRSEHIGFMGLLQQLGIVGKEAEETLPPELLGMWVHNGGPVSTERGFVLHSPDYAADSSTLSIDTGVCLTATIDILKDIARGKGPERSILALGYAGWAPGQLETEIQANGWLHCSAEADLIFDRKLELKYDNALSKIGIDPSHLVCEAGHA
jgi:putative transcriptional regulator